VKRSCLILASAVSVIALAAPGIARAEASEGWSWSEATPVAETSGWSWGGAEGAEPAPTADPPPSEGTDGWSWGETAAPSEGTDGWSWGETAEAAPSAGS
jgi:hypothetical protein